MILVGVVLDQPGFVNQSKTSINPGKLADFRHFLQVSFKYSLTYEFCQNRDTAGTLQRLAKHPR